MLPSRAKILAYWRACHFRNEDQKAMHEHLAVRALSYKAHYYDPVTEATGIPWYLVAALDMREESFNHSAYLGNGEPLYRKTHHVPQGRGPFKSWHEGAIDALVHVDHMNPAFGEGDHWDIVTTLIAAERFNGLGYEGHGPSPYVWAGTNIEVSGKFTKDGHFDPKLFDTQPGCAALFLALKQNHGIDLIEA